jgi:hypothetical protein
MKVNEIWHVIAELTMGNMCDVYSLLFFHSGSIQQTIIFFKSLFCNTDFISAIEGSHETD